MSSRRINNIKALSEQLGFLKITEEALSNYKQMNTEMSVVPALAAISKNIQTEMLKNMVLDPGWFDGNQTKFKDWWRGMRLFLKNNRVMETNDKITAILAHLRGGIAGIYTQRKLNCYELKSLGLDERTTLVLSNTRELNRELFYKLVYLI